MLTGREETITVVWCSECMDWGAHVTAHHASPALCDPPALPHPPAPSD